MLIGDAPLVRHRLVDTRSPEVAREEIGRIFCPHFLVLKERRPDTFHALRMLCISAKRVKTNPIASRMRRSGSISILSRPAFT